MRITKPNDANNEAEIMTIRIDDTKADGVDVEEELKEDVQVPKTSNKAY